MYSNAKANGGKMFAISRVAALVVIVIILAAAGIAYFAFYGGGGNVTTTGTSNSTGSTNTPTSTSTGTKVTTSTCTGDCVQTNTTGSQYGLVSVLISDPPHLPDGVSALYIMYPNMYLHLAGVPEADGWIQVSSSGSIELLGAVNIGETVAFASIPADEYNMIRFNVSSALVTYSNQNYSALVQNGNLTIHLIGTLAVDPARPSALIIDVSPFLFNFGSITNPSFVLKPSAISFCAPWGFATQQMQYIGNRFQFQVNHTWFWQYRNSYSPQVNTTAATLSNSSLSLTVANYGSQSLTINAITITSLQGTSMGRGASSMPRGLSGSAVFLLDQSASLTQLTRQEYGTGPMEISTMIWGSEGYTIAPSSSTTLSYSGEIQLSLRLPPYVQPGEIISGQQYMISLMGEGVCSSYVVTAS